ncbi:hypothetical protein IFM89_038813 [Coptis chinensis]|uniref:Uncharacterized protein n=1 Tax=Coptis chinensis TaxID=261450 RepID=A0A835HJN5_9MAGN|nr:hypothetical protein IFM89_038813 [Coptis chinensis]
MEVEEPFVGMEWSTLKSCRTYLRSYAIANRVIKSRKSDGFTTRCNKYEGQHSGKSRGDSKFKNRLADAIWVAEKMLDTMRLHNASYCGEYLTVKAYMRTYSRPVLPIPNDKDWGQSLPNPYGYTINMVDDPIFLTRGVMAIVRMDEQPGVFCTPPIKREKKSNAVKKRKIIVNYEKNDLSKEELDLIPDLVEDEVPTVVVEEFDELNPYNVNIDIIEPEKVYKSEDSESEGSEGYELVYEDFVE